MRKTTRIKSRNALTSRAQKTLVVCAVGALALASSAAHATTYDSTVESYNPLAYYTFNNVSGGQTTSAVNGYTLTLENGATVQSGAGPVVNGSSVPALVLNNGSSGAEYATSVGPNGLMGQLGSTATILATIDLASLPNNSRIYSIAGESASGDDLDLQINGNNTIDFYTNGGAATTTAPLTTADIGQPLYLAAVLNGNTAEVYIDGVLAATAGTGGRSDSGNPFYVGQSNVLGGRYFDGSISDVAVFNTALTAPDVASIFASASAPATVSAVPEPSAWLLIIAGLAAIGAALRGRRRASPVTA
jgi:hypothetical protein